MAIARRFPHAEIIAFDLNADMVEQLRIDMRAAFPMTQFHAFTHDIQQPLSQADIGGPVDLIVTSGVLEYADFPTTVRWLVQLLHEHGTILYSPLRNSFYGRMIGKIYECTPYTEEESEAIFTANHCHNTVVAQLPWYHPATFKELRIYQK